MRKILLVVMLFCLQLSLSVSADEKVTDLSWTITWQGITCSGTYTGKIVDGKPEGKGEFIGNLAIDDGQIIYSGKWKNGALAGKGKLIDVSQGLTYSGKFKNNKLNGKIIISSEDSTNTEEIFYSNDIPYGVYLKKEEDGKIIETDRFYLGYRLSEILQRVEEIEYQELRYRSEKYISSMLCVKCRVVEKKYYKKNSELYLMLLVENEKKEKYILDYSVTAKNVAVNYMEDLDIGDEINVYGSFQGVTTYETSEEVVGDYPTISAIGYDWEEYKKLNLNNLEFEYSLFLKYAQEYKNKSITITGIVQKIENTTDEEDVKIILSSGDYSEKGEQIYVCTIDRGDLENLNVLPLEGDKVEIKGLLFLYEVRKTGESDYNDFPIIHVKEINEE